jgi:hypothetical protein
MEDRGQQRGRGMSRRELIKRTLKTGAYAAPVVLSTTVPSAVFAAISTPSSALQDAALVRVGHNAVFDVVFQLNNGSTPIASGTLGQITSDGFGVAGGVFAFPVALSTLKSATSATLTYFLNVGGVRSPVAAAPPFTSGLVGLQNGTTTSFQGNVIQAPVGCPTPTQYQEYLDVALINGPRNTTFDFYVQPNTVGAPIKVATKATTPDGHVTVFAASTPITSAAAPTSVVVSVVPAGGSPASPSFTFTASGGTLVGLSCADVASTSGTAVGVAQI